MLIAPVSTGAFLILARIQREPDTRTHIHLTSYMHGLPMSLNNVFTDGQAETGTTNITASAPVGAVEPFENAREMFFRYADTIITELDQYMPAVGVIDAGYDGPILSAIL